MQTEDQEAKRAATSESTPIIAGLTQEQTQVIELLRTPKLSIKYMDEPTKQRIRDVMLYLHYERNISIMDIAKIIGNKTSGYVSCLFKQLGIKPRDFEEARLAGIRQKVRKYERKPFHGSDEGKAYLLGLRHGDLSVSRPFGDAIRVSTSTTHRAMAELFTKLFSPYGHVYPYPRYKSDTGSYEWNFTTLLDESFAFLLDDIKTCWDWVVEKESTILSYLAGIWDAEGSIEVSRNSRVTAIHLNVYNTNLDLVKFVEVRLRELGYKALGPYLDKRKGSITSKYRIERKKDYWKVVVAYFDQSQSLLRQLPLLHREKVAKKELALSLKRGDYWDDVRPRVEALRASIRAERQQFLREAQEEVAKRRRKNST